MTRLFAGWGFRAAAQPASFADCWARACEPGDWTFALIESRRQTPAWAAFHAWAAGAAPHAALQAWPESAIARIATASVSPRLMGRFATGSVCEALALHAACSQAHTPDAQITLVLRRIVSADRQATLAVAAWPAQILATGVSS